MNDDETGPDGQLDELADDEVIARYAKRWDWAAIPARPRECVEARRFARLIGVPTGDAYVWRLWAFAKLVSPLFGDLSGYTTEEIADAVEWPADRPATELLEALLVSGVVTRRPPPVGLDELGIPAELAAEFGAASQGSISRVEGSNSGSIPGSIPGSIRRVEGSIPGSIPGIDPSGQGSIPGSIPVTQEIDPAGGRLWVADFFGTNGVWSLRKLRDVYRHRITRLGTVNSARVRTVGGGGGGGGQGAGRPSADGPRTFRGPSSPTRPDLTSGDRSPLPPSRGGRPPTGALQTSEAFERWWAALSAIRGLGGVAKKKAWHAWQRHGYEDAGGEVHAAMLAAVRWQAGPQGAPFREALGKLKPAGYLRDERWRDEPPTAESGPVRGLPADATHTWRGPSEEERRRVEESRSRWGLDAALDDAPPGLPLGPGGRPPGRGDA